MAKNSSKAESTVADKLDALYELQKIDSEIDRIRIIRGELPLEVQDLEDELEGLETRISKLEEELADLNKGLSDKKNKIKDSEALIAKYKDQQNNVKNNREYDAITKEIEFQDLEIQLAQKKMKEDLSQITSKQEVIETSKAKFEERQKDLEVKQKELEEIVKETQKDEEALVKKSQSAKGSIEERLLTAYDRLRKNAVNGLAVVSIQRDSCGGCFNKIPPQRQLDIKAKKKIIICEHCGRILINDENLNSVDEEQPKKAKRTSRKKETA